MEDKGKYNKDKESPGKDFVSSYHSIPIETIDNALYVKQGPEAVRHVFRVASSLDSMVLGEPQILGQLKDAFEKAIEMKTTGILLNRLMKKAISVAKRIRTETRIAENAVSISYAAVELAKKIFEDLTTRVVMLLGAGDMAELAARHLINNGVRTVLVANRTYERACELARDFQGRPVKFDSFLQEMIHTDIIICSTGALNYVLSKDQVNWVMKGRKNKPMFIIDISVPRNIDPEINKLDNVYLYDIDDLNSIVDANLSERRREAEKAEAIIAEEVDVFLKWQASLDAVPTIVDLRQKAEDIRKEELKKALNKLGSLDDNEIKVIEALTNSIVNKLLHPQLDDF